MYVCVGGGSFQKLTHLLIVEIAKDFIVFIRQKEFLSFTSCSLSCDSHMTSICMYVCMCTFLGGEYEGVPLFVRIQVDNQRWMGVVGAQALQQVHRISKSL